MSVFLFIKEQFAKFQVKAWSLIILTALLYGSLLNNINLWTDEIYSVLMANDNLKNMFYLLMTEDSKPPLYYLYLKFVLFFFPKSYEILGAHFASYILLVAAQIFAATEMRRDYGDKVALWMMGLILLMPHSLWLAFEVRTYMLSALLMLMALVYGCRLLNKPTNLDFIKFTIASLLALYTHYYCAIWLMFLYGALGVFLIRQKNYAVLKKFLYVAVIVAVLFAPWILVPLQTAGTISQSWYVSMDFVKTSGQFFTNPLSGEMVQSIYFAFEILSASALSFCVVSGALSGADLRQKSPRLYQLLILAFFSVMAACILLLILSVVIRPMVTTRYMLIFSLIWMAGGAIVLVTRPFLQRGFFILALLGFCVSYDDIRAASFDKGYSNLAHDIRMFVPKWMPIVAMDNNNLFCEYYLPEYKCLVVVGEKGEILRLPSVLKNVPLYSQELPPVVFALSSYTQLSKKYECLKFDTFYRKSFGIDLCKINADDAHLLLQNSLKLRLNKY